MNLDLNGRDIAAGAHYGLLDAPISLAAAAMVMASGFAAYAALPDSRVTLDVANRMTVQHDRFGRVGEVQTTVVRVARKPGETVSIWLGKDFTKYYAVVGGVPGINSVTTTERGTVVTLDSQATVDDIEVALKFMPMDWGSHEFALRASIAERLSVQVNISQFVAPL